MIDTETILLAIKGLKDEGNVEQLTFGEDILPYIIKHKGELTETVEEVHTFRSSLLKTEISKKMDEINVLIGLL